MFLPGAGHIYLNRIGKGLLILALSILLVIPTRGIGTIILCVWAMVDAYKTAKRVNEAGKSAPNEAGK
jgi:TM2 domain-containing membrane protein YozV